MFNLEALKKDLRRDEGVRRKPYLCPAGKVTIGVGRNLEDVGITESEADYLLENDIGRVCTDLDHHLPWWREVSGRRQEALMNMCFNLGITRLKGFRKMLGALRNGRYEQAATEALESRWAKQVGVRAERIATMIREG